MSWLVGQRNEASAAEFIDDLASRIVGKMQMTTAGLKLYVNAIEGAFGGAIDYAMLTKLDGATDNDNSSDTRYSPGRMSEMERPWYSNLLLSPFVSRVKRRMLIQHGQVRALNVGHADVTSVPVRLFHYNFIRTHQTVRSRLGYVRPGRADRGSRIIQHGAWAVASKLTTTQNDLQSVVLPPPDIIQTKRSSNRCLCRH